MNGRFIRVLFNLVLIIILTALSAITCFVVIGTDELENIKVSEKEYVDAVIDPVLENDKLLTSGFVVSSTTDKEYSVYGNVSTNVKNGVLDSYKVNDNEIQFKSVLGFGITDIIYYNGYIAANKFYEYGDMFPDLFMLGDNLISVVHSSDNDVRELLVNSCYFSGEQNENGNFVNTYFDDTNNLNVYNYDFNHLFEYDNKGQIVKETMNNGEIKEYQYNNDVLLHDKLPSNSSVENNSIVYNYNNNEFKYVFDYNYNSISYLTDIYKNGKKMISLSYINSSVVSVDYSDGTKIEYLLDSDLKQLGMIIDGKIYYFLYDMYGNVYALLDEFGKIVNEYDYSAYGIPFIKGDIDFKNIILNNETIFEPESNVLIKGSEIIFTDNFDKISLDSNVTNVTCDDTNFKKHSSVYSEKSGISFDASIRAKVLEEIIAQFESEGYAAVSSVSLVDSKYKCLDIIDFYILNSECSGPYYKNVFAGDKIFKLVGKDDDYNSAQKMVEEYSDKNSERFIEYYSLYAPSMGNISFEGQFIYCDYLINYSSIGDGIIKYDVLENNYKYYHNYNNIYNYDSNSYTLYANKGFDIDDWNYTSIIPGVNKEQYNIVEQYISDALEVDAFNTLESVEYFDDTYFDSYVSTAYGDTMASFVDLDDESMLVLSSDGNITIRAIPLSENSEFRLKLFKTVALTVASVVVAGVISIVVPGSGVVLFAILKVALLNGLWSFASTFVLSEFIDFGREHLLGQQVNKSIADKLNSALESYQAGFITGAIIGAAKYLKFYKATGDPISKYTTATDRMNARLDALDYKYDNFILNDDVAARFNCETYRLQIYSTDYSSKNIANSVILCGKRDNFVLKNAIKIIDTHYGIDD